MMCLNDIIYYAEKYFSMVFVGQKEFEGNRVAIFTVNEKSLVNRFIQYFSPYKAQKLYDSHNENELYGIVLQ